MYKEATRLKLRYATIKGDISTEQLWDLSVDDLDVIAVNLQEELEALGKKSFLTRRSNADKVLKIKFDVVFDILSTKVEEAELAKTAKDRKEHNAKIDALIAKKQEEQLENLSVDELLTMKK